MCSRFGRGARRGSHFVDRVVAVLGRRRRPGAANVIVVPSVRRSVIVVRGPLPRPIALIAIVCEAGASAIAASGAPLFLLPNDPVGVDGRPAWGRVPVAGSQTLNATLISPVGD